MVGIGLTGLPNIGGPVAPLVPAPLKEIWYAQKSVQLVRDSFFRSDFLQNPYFKIFGQKWDQEVESIYARGVCLNYEQKPCD